MSRAAPIEFAKRRRLATGLLFGLMAAALLIAYLKRPEPLRNHAERLLEADISGDAGVLLRYAHPQEIEVNGLTADKVRQLWKEILLRPYADWHQVNKPFAYDVSDFAAGAEAKGGDGQANWVSRAVSIQRWDGVPRASLTERISVTWTFEKALRERKNPTGWSSLPPIKRIAITGLEGLDKDEAVLSRLGIKYIAFPSQGDGQLYFVPVAKLRQMWTEEYADPTVVDDPNFFRKYERTYEQIVQGKA